MCICFAPCITGVLVLDLTWLFEAVTSSKPNDLWINTALTMSSGDKDKQRCRVGAFVAGKKMRTTSEKGDGKLQQPPAKPQDRERLLEQSYGEACERSRSQTTLAITFYNKSIDDVTTHGALKHLQCLQGECEVSKEPTFEVDQTGSIAAPVKMTEAPSPWGQYGRQLGYDCEANADLFAAAPNSFESYEELFCQASTKPPNQDRPTRRRTRKQQPVKVRSCLRGPAGCRQIRLLYHGRVRLKLLFFLLRKVV
jgi:hypothetical protein